MDPPRAPLDPEIWDERQRRTYLEIATRCKFELCSSYSLVAIGLQAHYENAQVDLRASQPMNQWISDTLAESALAAPVLPT